MRVFPNLRLDAKESVRKMIYRWLRQKGAILAVASGVKGGRCQRLRPLGVATVMNPAQEEIIVEWIVDLRRDGIPVSASMLKIKALEVATEIGISEGAFAASKQWRKGFLARHALSFRVRTRQGQVSVADGQHTAAVFAVQVRAVMEALGITVVMNADQTAVTFELLPRKTVNDTGEKTVWARPSSSAKIQAENVEKRRGFGCDVSKEVRELQADHGVEIYGNRTGWWNEDIMIHYLTARFGERHVHSPPVLLLLGHFSAHWTDEVKAYACSKNVVLMNIPAGLTWRAQPADVSWIKPFEDSLRRSWLGNLRAQLANKTPGERFKLKAPTRQVVTAWATAAYESLSTTTIKNGFAKCGYVMDDVLHDDGGEVVDAEDVLQELVKEGIVSYRAKDIVTDEMDVISGFMSDAEED